MKRTALRWQLLLAIPRVFAKLVSYDPNGGVYLALEDVPAASVFGPSVPKAGITGRLRIGTPDLYGCAPLDFGQSNNDSLPLIALLSRSEPSDTAACTFETKVLNAQAAGAQLVVIYDSIEEPLFHMQKARDQNSIEVPAVLVTAGDGAVLRELLAASLDPLVFVDDSDPYNARFIKLHMAMIGTVIGFLLMLLLCGSFFLFTMGHLLRYEAIGGLPSQRLHQPLSMAEALALPEVKVTQGSDCSICLEEYSLGDNVIQCKQCSQGFHPGCLRPWLTERARTCPLCKTELTAERREPADIETASTEDSEATNSEGSRALLQSVE